MSEQNKITLLRQMIENAERNVAAAKQILAQIDKNPKKDKKILEASQVLEGAFDGEKMVGLDGKKYPVPPNYASKSKLVEGDLLKLTITNDGSFVYKQISPVERRKIMGIVMKDDKGKYYVFSEGKKYKVLLASLTYFKAKEGDEVTLVVPQEKISKWAAIEGVVGSCKGENLEESDISAKEKEEGHDEIKNIKDTGFEVGEDSNEGEKGNTHNKDEAIEDEWIPDANEIKKEAQSKKESVNEISDDLSG